MTTKLTNKQTTYQAKKVNGAEIIKLEGQITINEDDSLAGWNGTVTYHDEHAGYFHYSNQNGRVNINIDTSNALVDIFNTILDGVSDIIEAVSNGSLEEPQNDLPTNEEEEVSNE